MKLLVKSLFCLEADRRQINQYTKDYCLYMAKDWGEVIAFWAFYTFEVGVGTLYQVLFLISSSLLEEDERNILTVACSHRVTVPPILYF